MKTIKTHHLVFATVISVLMLTSCDPEQDNQNEQEIITTLRVTATPQPSGTPLVYELSDPDGDGGNSPVTDTIYLAAGVTYNVALEILNESVTPTDTITHEIEEEGVDHQFFFIATGVNVTTAYNDVDLNGNPIGLESVWTTGAASTGTLEIRLKHQPGIKDGNITTGETDIQAVFPAIIQ